MSRTPGCPRLLRDSQVFPIWEGTTNVLSLDALRALAQDGRKRGALDGLTRKVDQCLAQVRDPGLEAAVEVARRAVTHAGLWAVAAAQTGSGVAEAGARRLAMTLGRGLASRCCWSTRSGRSITSRTNAPALAARRFARSGIDLIADIDPADSVLLLRAGAR